MTFGGDSVYSLYLPMKIPSHKILHTCFSLSWGGLEIHSLAEATKLAARGHHVWLACCRGSRLEQEAQERGIPIVPLKISGYFHPAQILQLRRLLLEEEIALVHSQHSKDLATVVPAVKLTSRTIPVLLSKRVGSSVMKRDPLHRFTYRYVSRVLAISDVIRRNVIATTPMAPDRVITLHHGVNITDFSLAKADRSRFRRELGGSDAGLLIGFVGRFSPGKGLEEFLGAAAILVKNYPALRFAIVGEASYGEKDYEQAIRELCTGLNLDGVVTFTGFRTDVPDVMASFDIFAFPSHAESFGAVLVEAMALERPVVSTNCDGVVDIVVDGETGLYVNPGRADELARAIARLAEDRSLRERLGKAGRARVVELFDQEKQIARVEQIYLEVLKESADG